LGQVGDPAEADGYMGGEGPAKLLLHCELWHVTGRSGVSCGNWEYFALIQTKKENLSFDSFLLGLSSWEGSCALGRVGNAWVKGMRTGVSVQLRAGCAWVRVCLDQGHLLLLTSF